MIEGTNLSAVDDFLRKVLRSGLLTREQLQTTLRSLSSDRRDQVPAIVDHLIQHGMLTRFQAHKISQGITVGLTLGPYRIQAPLGRGGMGTVYLALDTRSKQHVALKILPPKLAREEERMLARFQREMELSRKVNHPHIARTMDAGVQQNVHFIAMEYIPGQTLYRLVMTKGPLPVPLAAQLFAEAASGLAHAHAQGLIHRDMKPSNIMVTPHEHAKVLDLGLAFTEGEVVEDIEVVGGKGYIVGSIDYMAPEQTRDPTSIDARADIYALGCCLYFALTGKPPFPTGTVHEKVRAHRQELPESLRQKNPLIPEAFADLVHKMLAKSPDVRFATASDVVAALAPWRRGAAKPLDTPDDPAFQQAVREVIGAWVAPEASKDVGEDAVIFRIDPEDRPAPAERLSRSIFSDIDRVKPHFWLILALAFWLIVLSCCVVSVCIVPAFR